MVDLVQLNKFVERPTHPFPAPKDTIARIPVGSKYFAANRYWQIPFNEEEEAGRWVFQNLPPNPRYQVVPEWYDVGGFSGNFRVIMDERTWWGIQKVNNCQIKHVSMADRRGFEENNMAESFGIHECVQANGEPVYSWLIRAASTAVEDAFRKTPTTRREESFNLGNFYATEIKITPFGGLGISIGGGDGVVSKPKR